MVTNFKTHWGRVTHICVSKLTTIGSDNGLSPGRRQAIIWTNDGIMLIGPLGTNFSENLIESYALSFRKMHLKISSGKWWPFCLGLNVLIAWEMSCHRLSKLRDEITHPFPNFKCCTVEVSEWISNFTPLFKMGVITYSCRNLICQHNNPLKKSHTSDKEICLHLSPLLIFSGEFIHPDYTYSLHTLPLKIIVQWMRFRPFLLNISTTLYTFLNALLFNKINMSIFIKLCDLQTYIHFN